MEYICIISNTWVYFETAFYFYLLIQFEYILDTFLKFTESNNALKLLNLLC